MGMSGGKSKTESSNKPPKWAKPYILENLQQQQQVFRETQPQLMEAAANQRATYGRLAPGAEAGIMASQDLVNRNLSGANLQGNPYLNAILGRTRESVSARVGDEFGKAGRFGGGMHQAILARELANAENQMRYADYGQERAYQQDAISDAQNLMGGSQSLINSAAELPWIGVQAANGAVRQASAGYGTQKSTTTQRQPWGPMLLDAASSAAQAAMMASDRRLKRQVELLSRLRDGLGVYRWTYLWGERATGVMADEVAAKRPWALGPTLGGYATVNMGAL